jgi:hypothetical protein
MVMPPIFLMNFVIMHLATISILYHYSHIQRTCYSHWTLVSLQHYYGKAADDFFRKTRTGILRGTFWGLYCDARRQAYTKENIKQAFRTTGIFPFNRNAVLTKLPGGFSLASRA